jgi:L-ascorbate metabolism protein UlaG (beta-lactamase superfamily)
MSAIAPALYAVVSNPATAFAQPEDAKELKHHLKRGKGFTNPWPSFEVLGVFELGWMMAKYDSYAILYSYFYGANIMLRRRLTGQINIPDTTPPTVNVRKPDFLSDRTTTKLRATWLGHACYYVEFPGGFRVLFDPVFEPCCSPINISILKRYTPIPCEIEDIPIIDAVVISHSHYDHLSHPSIMRIHKKHPNAHFFVGLGLQKWFNDSGIHSVTELDWWQSREIKLSKHEGEKVSVNESGSGKTEDSGTVSATIHALPCQHVSGRTAFDRNRTLWASWAVESGGANVYFAGFVSLPPSSSFAAVY